MSRYISAAAWHTEACCSSVNALLSCASCSAAEHSSFTSSCSPVFCIQVVQVTSPSGTPILQDAVNQMKMPNERGASAKAHDKAALDMDFVNSQLQTDALQ